MSYPGSGQVEQRLSGDSWEDDTVERRSHQLFLCRDTGLTDSEYNIYLIQVKFKHSGHISPLTPALAGPVDKQVHGADLSDLLVLAVKP